MQKKKKLAKTITILQVSIHIYDDKEDQHDTRPTESIKADPEIEKLLKILPDKDVSELRKMWEEYFGEKAPKWNKSYLILRLSYKIQEVHYATTLRPKVKIAFEDIYKGKIVLPTKSRLRKEGKFKIKIGTALERNYQGRTYQVIKTKQGYLFEDKLYQLLSAIASRITKQETKGCEFFGLI